MLAYMYIPLALASMTVLINADGGPDRMSEDFEPFCYYEPTDNITNYKDFISIDYTRPLCSDALMFAVVPGNKCNVTLYVPIPDNGLPASLLKHSTLTCTDVTHRSYHANIESSVFVPVENWPVSPVIRYNEWGLLTISLARAVLQGIPSGVTEFACFYSFPVASGVTFRGTLIYHSDLKACPRGTYGIECNSTCNCQNGASCHSFNGACWCAPGWRGETCEQIYPEVVVRPSHDEIYISNEVNLTCGVYHMNVSTVQWYYNNNKIEAYSEMMYHIPLVIDVKNGDQQITTGTYSCEVIDIDGNTHSGIYNLSTHECPPGMWGVLCSFKCLCSDNATCERESGCLCIAGLMGNTCSEACDSGYYGRNCTGECICKNGGLCDSITGNCNCTEGWQGPGCTDEVNQATPAWLIFVYAGGGALAALAVIGVLLMIYSRRMRTPMIYTSATERLRMLEDIVNSDNIIDGEADVMVQDIKKWIIKASELKIDNVIGEGGFGIVFRAKYKKAEVKEITVAVKTMRGNASSMEERSLLSEAYNHIRLGIHNNIVNIHGIVVNDGPLKLVVEYAEQGDLLAYLHYLDKLNKAQRSLFSERVSQEGLFLTDVAIHVAQGLEFLHSKHVIHRDIAARNVVIYGDGIGKICDLGLSRDVYQTIYCKRPSPSDEERDMQLPIRWMAPETLAGDFVYSNKSDMWSYGVLLWEISALGQRPYHHVKPEHLLSIIRYGNIKLKKCAGCPIELYNVMKHCWQEDVKNRPSAGEMVLRLRRLKHQKKIYFCDPIIPVDVLTSVPRQSVPRHKYTNTIQINSMELSVFE